MFHTLFLLLALANPTPKAPSTNTYSESRVGVTRGCMHSGFFVVNLNTYPVYLQEHDSKNILVEQVLNPLDFYLADGRHHGVRIWFAEGKYFDFLKCR